MKIKICGLKRDEDIDYVNLCKPDYVGFVFAGTKRKIDFETARRLKHRLSRDIQVIGVFVDADITFICELVKERIIEGIQLHGDEDFVYLERLKCELDIITEQVEINSSIPIIKAVRVQSTEQILEADKLKVDYLLLDAFSVDEYGGSGNTFDHLLIPKLTKPYILAGGIDLKNVNNIVEQLEKEDKLPTIIDASSSVETSGFKDKFKIEQIVDVIHKM